MPEDRDSIETGPDVEESNQIPQEATPPTFQGAVSYSCCGIRQQASLTKGTTVVCRVCHTAYSLTIEALAPEDGLYPPGTKLRLLRDVQAKVGSKHIIYHKGEEVIVGSDMFSLLGTLENQTLVCFESPALTGQSRTLLVALPNDALEEVPSV